MSIQSSGQYQQHRFVQFILPLVAFVTLCVVSDFFLLQGSNVSWLLSSSLQSDMSSSRNSGTHYSRIEFNEETSISKEQISIRTNIVDSSTESFHKFILHYTGCNAVNNILLLPVSSVENVNVAHTVKMYRKVKWMKFAHDTSEIGNNNAVLVLDSDVIIPCSDLEFAFSVWLSARDSAVGFFPRLVLEDRHGDEGTRFAYLGPMYVWWQVNCLGLHPFLDALLSFLDCFMYMCDQCSGNVLTYVTSGDADKEINSRHILRSKEPNVSSCT